MALGIRAQAMQPPLTILSSAAFWNGIVELPLVKPELLETLLLHEVTKSYPKTLSDTAAVRWEILPNLSVAADITSHRFLVQIPLGTVQNGITDLQGLLRCARLRSFKGACGVVAYSRDHLCAIIPGTDNRLELYQGSELELRSLLPTTVPLYVYRSNEAREVFTNVSTILPEYTVTFISNKELLTKPIQSEGQRNDGTRQLKQSRYVALTGIALLVCMVGFWGFRYIAERAELLAGLRSQLGTSQKNMQTDQSTLQNKDQLSEQVAILEKLIPVDVYSLLEHLAGLLSESDRILGVRWEGGTSTFVVDIASKEAVRLLDTINKAGMFRSITSSNMVPVEDNPGFFRFSLSGTLSL